MDFMAAQRKYSNSDTGNIYNTSRVIEGKFMNLLEKEPIKRNKMHWGIGPFNPVMTSSSSNNSSIGQRHKCLTWLDKQSPKSVIFISFGTTTSLTDEQIKELCIGLERSETKLIWALRDADKGDIFSGEVRKMELPNGYEERIKNKGIIVRDWAPQLEILGHFSIGGFMSHCGWNSRMESLSMGVPIIAWPMHSDQPRNSILISKFLKVGILVNNWERRNEVVTSNTVERAVKTLVLSNEGNEIRKRAADLGVAIRKSVVEGGVTSKELESFIGHITR
uniref:Zeatin O-xylosyltransferase-like n=2 Tax=cellular organisms TaxID=131567 RepID=A0A1S4BXW4_TOBAC|nr:PREDICTED: zeatin O-xylosyltransferase-like [Nicotiana tabacum]